MNKKVVLSVLLALTLFCVCLPGFILTRLFSNGIPIVKPIPTLIYEAQNPTPTPSPTPKIEAADVYKEPEHINGTYIMPLESYKFKANETIDDICSNASMFWSAITYTFDGADTLVIRPQGRNVKVYFVAASNDPNQANGLPKTSYQYNYGVKISISPDPGYSYQPLQVVSCQEPTKGLVIVPQQ